jgi:hypothetical protein
MGCDGERCSELRATMQSIRAFAGFDLEGS